MLLQILINLSYGVTILLLLLQVIALTRQLRAHRLECQHRHVEHKDDAVNLERRITSIAVGPQFIEGRRPIPIMPIAGQLRDADRKGELYE